MDRRQTRESKEIIDVMGTILRVRKRGRDGLGIFVGRNRRESPNRFLKWKHWGGEI